MITRKGLIRANQDLRANDDSHLWPILGRFNVTNRAILRVRNWVHSGGVVDDVESYKSMVRQQIILIVNDPKNW